MRVVPLSIDWPLPQIGAVLSAFGRDYCDGLGMKVTRVGGLGNMAAVRDMAEARRSRTRFLE